MVIKIWKDGKLVEWRLFEGTKKEAKLYLQQWLDFVGAKADKGTIDVFSNKTIRMRALAG